MILSCNFSDESLHPKPSTSKNKKRSAAPNVENHQSKRVKRTALKRKRSGNIGRKTINAKRVKIFLQNETEEETKARLEKKKSTFQNQSEGKKKAKAKKEADRRSNETTKQRAKRLQTVKQSMEIARQKKE